MMKYLLYLPIGLCFLLIFSCANDSKQQTEKGANPITIEELASQSAQEKPVRVNPPIPEPPQNADGVWHFTCAKGCEGGSGVAEACKGCGGPLAHNAAYHNTTTNVNQDVSAATPTAPPTIEPPQNANGVWHFTCPNGCDGGSGTAEACGGCGTTLAHNAAYHS